ncbi:unnamed protein product [Brassica rapa subsp. trilocularis]
MLNASQFGQVLQMGSYTFSNASILLNPYYLKWYYVHSRSMFDQHEIKN